MNLPDLSRVILAPLWITADRHSVLYLDGRKVPGSDVAQTWRTTRFVDVRNQLVVGTNTIAIEVVSSGNLDERRGGMLARLIVAHSDRDSLGMVQRIGERHQTSISIADR